MTSRGAHRTQHAAAQNRGERRLVVHDSVTMTSTSPRDPAVDAVLTAETLFAQFIALAPRLTSLLPADVSTAMGEAQGLYPELWAALDRGREVLRDRGIESPAFDEARARQPSALLGFEVNLEDRSHYAAAGTLAAFMFGGPVGVAAGSAIDIAGLLGAKHGATNKSGLRDARTAIDALKAAMPEVDWATVQQRETRDAVTALDELARARHKKILVAIAGVAAAVLFAVGLVKILQSSAPPTDEEIREQKDIEFRAAQDEIRDLNAVLKQNPCAAAAAERRARLFVTNGQPGTGRKLAKKFLDQCGDNPTLRAIADGR